MLDVALLREEPDKVKKGIQSKGASPDLVDQFLALDQKWRALVQEVDGLRALQNALSKERNIGEAKKNKATLKTKEEEIPALEKERDLVLGKIPNLPLSDVPLGKSEADNKVIRSWGEPTKFDFKPKDHLTLGQELGVIDVEKAGQVSGTRFAYLKGDLVLLEFALARFALQVLTDREVLKTIGSKIAETVSSKPSTTSSERRMVLGKPFVPVVPPVMIRPEVYKKMARLNEGEEDERYYIPKDDLYLVGSAEHTLGPLHMGDVLEESALPLRYIGFSTAFRREAGSYGKDTRGILRVHQFDKLEMESFSLPEDSLHEQEFLVAIQEYLMQSLELPHQVVAVSTGDMGAPDARQIDLETWMPGEGRYRETHTADLNTDYQARRLHTRVKRATGEMQFVHMNDATAFAIGRTLIAIIENYQTKEGAIRVPKVLQLYVGKELIGKQ